MKFVFFVGCYYWSYTYSVFICHCILFYFWMLMLQPMLILLLSYSSLLRDATFQSCLPFCFGFLDPVCNLYVTWLCVRVFILRGFIAVQPLCVLLLGKLFISESMQK
jgi:hypothetical protein